MTRKVKKPAAKAVRKPRPQAPAAVPPVALVRAAEVTVPGEVMSVLPERRGVRADEEDGDLPGGISDRRANRGRANPLYRWLRGSVMSLSVLAVLALVGLVFTALSRPDLSGPAYLALINLNLVLLVVMVLYTARKLLVMFLDRRGRLRNGRLHLRLVGIFGILAVVPAMVVAGLAIFLLNQGIESWFSSKVSAALEGSLQVAQAYLDEHERGLLIETDALAREGFWREQGLLMDQLGVQRWLAQRADEHRLDELAVVDESGAVQSAGDGMGSVVLPAEALEMMRAGSGGVESFKNLAEGRVTAVAPLPGRLWLVAQRWVNPAVLARVDQTNAAYQEYYGLRQERVHIRQIVTLFLLILTGGALTGAIWTGIRLANKIVRPVTALVHATNRVSAGDLEVRLSAQNDDELGVLTGSFNRMALQLQNNRELLEKKNHELDERRRQMEAVLTGVTAGVVSLDAHGAIRWANAPANALFNLRTGGLLEKATPELAEVFQTFVLNPRSLAQEQLRVTLADGTTKTLLVRLVPQYVEGGRVGSVVMTFDDVTPLIGAQRLAAWRDVARRLAHEIKNPLTPIQLSAERLRRKYLSVIPEADRELFGQLAATIVNQAEDMRRMTNEFSDFARMPTAHLQEENLMDLVEQAVLLQRAGRGQKISFETEYRLKHEEAQFFCDRGQVNRVLVNVIENAVNAIEEKPDSSLAEAPRAETSATAKGKKTGKAIDKSDSGQKSSTALQGGHIKIVVKKTQPDILQIDILDNGRGLPADVETEHLFDPYVTTRKNGTGLGLAIVRRVMDEHEGQVMLRRRPEGGTVVELTFPRQLKGAKKTAD